MELVDAEFVVSLCQMFHCLPSQLDEEDAEIVRLVGIMNRGTRKDEEE